MRVIFVFIVFGVVNLCSNPQGMSESAGFEIHETQHIFNNVHTLGELRYKIQHNTWVDN